jgi:hypothetical protein
VVSQQHRQNVARQSPKTHSHKDAQKRFLGSLQNASVRLRVSVSW